MVESLSFGMISILKIHRFSHNFPLKKKVVMILNNVGQYSPWHVINFLFQIQCKIRHSVVKDDTPYIYLTSNHCYFNASDLPDCDFKLQFRYKHKKFHKFVKIAGYE